MPTISIDTFFACSLMVILVVTAMAATSHMLSPFINNTGQIQNERYREFSKYLLLNEGKPSNWGENFQTIPEVIGLAKASSAQPYDLDADKVSRLNSENIYAISYSKIFNIIGMQDLFFRLEIKPLFDTSITLAKTTQETNNTTYQFKIQTHKEGKPVKAKVKYYLIAENYTETSDIYISEGTININLTIPNDIKGPALLGIFSQAAYNDKMVSFACYSFAHNSQEPKLRNTFLKLSPLNNTLTVSLLNPQLNISKAYGLTLSYQSILNQSLKNNHTIIYDIPNFADSSPILLIVTGWNSTDFFSEWTVYPQIPLRIGANLENRAFQSNVFSCNYVVTINSVLYECTFWLGGLVE